MPPTAPSDGRRTQRERRAATQQALLDAALKCLLEDGFAGLTTRRVAARAGVSAATLRFYYPTRAAFTAAAAEQLSAELLRQHRARLADHPAAAGDDIETWLDQLWALCKGPAFDVLVELSGAARKDQNARDNLAVAERAVTRHVSLAVADLFPDQVSDPRFRAITDLATASMRGLVMLAPAVDPRELEQRWDAMRTELGRLYAELLPPR